MSQNNNRRDYIAIDFSYIFRSLWKNAFIIIMCACMTGVAAYVFLDNYQSATYTASVNLSVVARDNSSGKLAEYNVGSAVNRCLNVLNSDILREQIAKSDLEGKLTGSLSAARVASSNIITLKATSSSAESAFRLLKAALEEYPSLSSYFESGYMLKNLDTVSAGNIIGNYPRNAYYAAFAALLVLFAGIGMTGVMCLFTDRIHSKEQAEAILDLDILGVQHYIEKKKQQKAILVSDDKTDLSYIEEINKLVTVIREKMDAHNHKVLLISSVKENEGKSTMAANIALSLAGRDKKVLLVDADLRRPAIYNIFEQNMDEISQFSQFLDGTIELQKVLKFDKENHISYLLQKKGIADPVKLLESVVFKNLLKKMSTYMDYIIIDTPPLGIVQDAEIIAGCADAALLILKQDNVQGSVVNDVVDVLDDTGITVLGGVLTMAKGTEISRSTKGRYGKYYSGYGYGKQ